ncbi:MAG: F0F1 ATP synthase subunit B [Chloroflexi bacterium]|nr:F0F1 ATP synthase subunit B [Chloroflexota bacterium]
MSALGINLPGLIAQIVNFLLLLLLLYLLLYKPVLKMLDSRSARIKESLDEADKLRQEVARSDQEAQARLEEARREGQDLIAQAGHIGERLKEEARQDARREAEAIIERARSEIQMERDEAIVQLRQQFADLAIMAAEKVIKASLDRLAHQRLIQEVLDESTARRDN